jgi:pimeloyl-ACP methyl ester carboxylesterase
MERFVSFDGVEIAYATFDPVAPVPVSTSGPLGVSSRYQNGWGPRPVLLLHGYASTHRANWVRTGVVDALAASGRPVVAIDARGHGQSGTPHQPHAYDGDAMVADARALLDHLALDAVDVVGYSMGAMVALRLAAADGRVRSVVLGGVGGDGRPPRPGGVLSKAMLASSSKEIENRTARAFRMFADLTGADKEALAAIDRSDSMRSEVDFDAIVVPALVLVGEKDTLIAPPEELVARLPDARLVRVPGDHLSCLRNGEVTTEILRFLDEVGTGEPEG